jgi:dGTPase
VNWEQLISQKRLGQELRHTERRDDRSEFKRDYDRLIFSAPFRRMQNKTQVFPLPGSVFVHNRLTHSLEVASVGMSLGNDINRGNSLGTIVATACLAHDMGNPPFGHSGEKAIQTFFTEGPGNILKDMISPEVWSDVTHFEGNANAFRLLTHRFQGRREGGYAMTYTTLASIVKYPYPSTQATPEHPKFGYFSSEADIFNKISNELGMIGRHPLVYLVEAADDICYEIMDIEDAHKLKILSDEETLSLLFAFFDEEVQQSIRERIERENISDVNEQVVYLRASVIGKLENECVKAFLDNEDAIMNGTFKGSLIEHISPRQRDAYVRCTEVAIKRIYKSKSVLDIELGGYSIIETLMTKMVEAILHPDRYYSKQLLMRVSSQYEISAPDLETRIMAVLDFISGMTDVFALDFYQKINGTSLPIV